MTDPKRAQPHWLAIAWFTAAGIAILWLVSVGGAADVTNTLL